MPSINNVTHFLRFLTPPPPCHPVLGRFDRIIMLNTREMGTLETTWSSYFTHCLVYQSEDYFIQNYEEGEPTRCASEGVDIRIMGYMISNMVFFMVTNNLLCILFKSKSYPRTKYRPKQKFAPKSQSVTLGFVRICPSISGFVLF